MKKNLFIALAVLSGMAISMTACLLGDVEALQHKASETNLGVTVNIAEIRGVTVPAPGGIPVKNIIDNDQYAGTVSWSPMPGNSGFNLGSKYTATITITPKKGYTLHLVKANFFTVVGAESVSNATNSGIVTAVFPDTKMVTDIAIKTQPANLLYTHGDTLDLTGLVVMLTYDDSSTEDVTSADFTVKSITATPAQGNSLIHLMHNGQPVKITYGNLTVNTNNLTVNRATPTTTDFYVSGIGTFVYNDNSRAVTITPKNGKITGSITVKYNGITTAPSAVGTYTVTFDVATSENFNAVNNLSAGILTIIYTTFNSIDGLNTYLQGKPDNTAATPYTVALNVSDLGGISNTNGSVGYMLDQNPTKYVNLDLSGSTITSIEWSAFGFNNKCSNLTSITIPNGVTSIGSGALSGCKGLTTINVDSGNVNYISDQGVLYDKNKTTLVVYPAGKKDSSFIIPNSVTSIGSSAFYYSSLTEITIPDSVTSIGGYAFYWCTSLTSVNIPNSVTSIGGLAFYWCTSLTSVTMPKGVTSIKGGAFYNCWSLTTVTFEGTINSDDFDDNAFGYSDGSGYIGDLRDKYLAGGKGTYTRAYNGTVWTKQS